MVVSVGGIVHVAPGVLHSCTHINPSSWIGSYPFAVADVLSAAVYLRLHIP